MSAQREISERDDYIVVAEVGIPGVLSDTRSLFADSTVRNIVQGYTCVVILEYIALFPVASSDSEEYDDENQRGD